MIRPDVSRMDRPRLLFVLKHRENHWGGYGMSSGLLNSVRFIVDMLTGLGVSAKMVDVADNNGIDAEVTAYRPTHVVIEAFWVVPEKFDTLRKLHPHVHWAIRNHSETPFLANEGISADWLFGYLSRGVEVMCNSPRSVTDLQALAQAYGGYERMISYAPNVYPIGAPPQRARLPVFAGGDLLKIGCFGAIRPLKNQFMQAIAAIRFAHFLGRKLEFHVNGGRIEGDGAQILKNLTAVFSHTRRAELVPHPWLNHADFLTLVSEMDFCMQCSFSETFNIVSADAVGQGVPVIASREVCWLGNYGCADPTDSNSMLQNLIAANMQIRHHEADNRIIWQWRDLYRYSQKSTRLWQQRFGIEPT